MRTSIVPRAIGVLLMLGSAVPWMAGATLAARQNTVGQPRVRLLLPLRDDGRDPDLLRMREAALSAATRESGEALAVLAAPGSELHSRLNATSKSHDARFWRGLLKALKHGGTFVADGTGKPRWCAPYAYGHLQPEAFEKLPQEFLSYEVMPVVVLAQTELRVESRADTPVVDVLSFELAKAFSDPADSDLWIQLGLPGRVRGWTTRDRVWSVADLHVCFERAGGSWQLSEVEPW